MRAYLDCSLRCERCYRLMCAMNDYETGRVMYYYCDNAACQEHRVAYEHPRLELHRLGRAA